MVVFAVDGSVAAGVQAHALLVHALLLAEPGPSFQGGGAWPNGAALSACFTLAQVSFVGRSGEVRHVCVVGLENTFARANVLRVETVRV